jgi:hypothetical protein
MIDTHYSEEMSSFLDTYREHMRWLRGSQPASFDALSLFGISMSENQHSAFLA